MADEKYRLTLEGSDIDEALLRLANYEDEGLVLGSRKGVMLGPGSEYYHKNARYYAELAQSAVPGDTTSAVRWDIDQSALTDADREMARKNIRAGGSNRNLLDNPWFTVNQRGFSSGQTGILQPWVDRWLMNSDPSNPATLTFSDGVATIQAPSGGFCNILQTLADPSSIVGKVVTLSVLKSDGTIISGTITRIAGTTQDAYSTGGITLRLSSTNRFAVQADSGASISIKACKLELGFVSTLTNDAPPDYGTELAKCKYYFRRIAPNGGMAVGFGAMAAPNTGYITIPAQMRTSGTITASFSGTATLRGAGASGTVTAISAQAVETDGVRLNVTISGSIAGNQPAMLWFENNSYLDLSADL